MQQQRQEEETREHQQQGQRQRQQQHRRRHDRHGEHRRMYGDLVNGLCYTAFVPVYMYLWLFGNDGGANNTCSNDDGNNDRLLQEQQRQPPSPMTTTTTEATTTATTTAAATAAMTIALATCDGAASGGGARNIVLSFVWTAACCWISYLYNSAAASCLACLGMSVSIAGMNLYQWPHRGEVVILPQFFWTLLVIGANQPLSFAIKAALGGLGFVNAVFVAAKSPLLSVADTLPVLLGAAVVHVLFHYYTMKKQSLISARGASLILAGTFAYHVAAELTGMMLQPGYALEGGYSILKAGFFAAIGLAAAGAFRQEIVAKEVLEVLVQERTAEIRAQAEKLYMVSLALQASETAICIAGGGGGSGSGGGNDGEDDGSDDRLQLVWYNAAMQRLTGKFGRDELRDTSLSDILPEAMCRQLKEDGFLLGDVANPEHDIIINGTAVSVEISPFFPEKEQEASEENEGDNNNGDNKNGQSKSEATAAAAAGAAAAAAAAASAPTTPMTTPCGGGDDDDDDRHGDNKKDKDSDDDDDKNNISGRRFLVVLKNVTALRQQEEAQRQAQQQAIAAQAMRDAMQNLSHELRTPLQGILGMTSLLLEEQQQPLQLNKESLNTVMISGRLLLTLINNMLDTRKMDCRMMQEFTLSNISLQQCLIDAYHFCTPFATIMDVQLSLDGNFLSSRRLLVESNALRFQQVMINLLSNAIKHTKAPLGTVRVETAVMSLRKVQELCDACPAAGLRQASWDALSSSERRDHKVAVISVSDEGPGIPDEQCARVFEKFVQLQPSPHQHHHGTTTTTEGRTSSSSIGNTLGTGLGLDLCLKFVHRMKGAIWVHRNDDQRILNILNDNNGAASHSMASKYHAMMSGGGGVGGPAGEGPPQQQQQRRRGMCFSFCVPLGEDDERDDSGLNGPEAAGGMRIPSSALSIREQTPRKPVGADRYRVLVVDDAVINLKVLGRMLKRAGVREVTAVHTAQTALIALEHGEYNLVMTDVQMPDMTGPELSRAIKFNPAVLVKPVVVALTAELNNDTDLACRESGIAHVLYKPITTAELYRFFDQTVATLPTVGDLRVV